ncbi:hypothetical protein Q9R19_13510 [Microbacterium sp. ARD32]|uniref:hypothetical protein n=1 Tax=Microbacterium sp. ARD32 TaxID=2962577 RepID=UPI002881D5F1|nr:hypothetical protein [Microbacterium sp. ARD32]MDT0158641.1 hypothetical protein [Microbacterium sp. ARD32]
MPEKVHKLHIVPDAPPPAPAPESRSFSTRGLDRVLSVQRPLVVAHLRSIRLRHPTATPQDIIKILETRYLAAVTTGGAAVGAAAVVPGVGTGITLALSGAETVGFMESTALFAQSVAEVHGIAVQDPERARALVMALMLGKEGIDLVSQLTRQAAGKGGTRASYWGELVTKSLPRAAVGPLVDRLKSEFIRQFASRGSASFLGKALPFGVGAAVGGAGNHLLGRRVLSSSRRAFGFPPPWLPPELEPVAGSERLERRMLHGARLIGANVASRTADATARTARAVRGATQRVGRRRSGDSEGTELDAPSTSAD